MAQDIIDIGPQPNDGQGDNLRTAFDKTNDNFTQIWTAGPVGSNVRVAGNVISTLQVNQDLALSPNGVGNVRLNNNTIPGANNTWFLGSATMQWRGLYAASVETGNITITGTLDVPGDAVIQGNLTVEGNTIQIGNIVTDTKTIQLANTAANTIQANGSGITVGANDNIATILYNSTSNVWTTNIGVTATGNITAPYFFGNGSQLTGITSYSNANATSLLASFGSNTISTTGNITAGYFAGNGSLLTGIASTYGNANVVANLAALGSNPISTTGNITANYFVGNGSQLTGIVSSYGNANVANYLPTFSGNISAGNVSASGNITGNYFIGDGSQLTNLPGGNTDWANIGNITNANGPQNIAIGENVHQTFTYTAGFGTVAIGYNAGQTNQGGLTVAVGWQAGQSNQSNNAIAIGYAAGQTGQEDGAVAIGAFAGAQLQGADAIAIGKYAGYNGVGVAQPDNTIFLNATGTNMGGVPAQTNSFYVAPVRNDVANVAEVMFYNTTSKEITYGNTVSISGNISGNYILGNGSQITNLPAPVVTQDISSSGAMSIMLYDGNIKYNNYATVEPSSGNITGGNISTTGNVTANYFVGLLGSITNLDSLNFTVENISALQGNNGVNIGAGGYNNLVVLPTEVLIQNVPLTVAGNLVANQANGLYITANAPANGTAQIWNFGSDGRLTFPGTPRIDTDSDNFEVQAAESINFEANAVVNIYTDSSGNAYQWQFGDDGLLTFPDNLVIAGNTNVFGLDSALITPAPDLPLIALSAGANGAVNSVWVEDPFNVGTSNIAAVYVNPTPGSGNVRIAVGQNGNAGPNLWDFDTTGNLTLPTDGYLVVTTGIIGSGASPAPSLSGFSSIATTGSQGNISASGNLLISGYANITGNINGGNLSVSGNITGALRVVTTPTGLANLSAVAGGRAFVNNANLVAVGNFGNQVGSGGSNIVPVWSDGSNWYIG